MACPSLPGRSSSRLVPDACAAACRGKLRWIPRHAVRERSIKPRPSAAAPRWLSCRSRGSARISSVCSPSVGARWRIEPGVIDSHTGALAIGAGRGAPGYSVCWKKPDLLDVRVVQRLLRRVDGARRDLGLGQDVERLGGRVLRAPLAHALADDVAVVAARHVVLEARVGQPVLLAHQLGPALEHRLADHLRDDPAVLGAEQIGRRRGLAAVVGRHAVGLDHRLLDQRGRC